MPGDDAIEPPEERSYRHAMEGRLQFATVEALTQLSKTVEKTAVDVAEMRGWFMGVAHPDGSFQPGVLHTVSGVRVAVKWIIGLLGTATTALIVQTVHALFPHFIKGIFGL